MKRTLIVLVLLAAVAGLIFSLFGGEIAKRALRVGIERRMSADPIAALPDGLHVVLCGAGGPLPDPVRGGPCVAVIAGGKLFVVDAGSGGSRTMTQLQIPPARTEAVLLTHFHSDHIDGLGEMALQAWAGGARKQPLPVHGPNGVAQVVDGFNAAYALDFGYRVAHHGAETVPPSGAGTRARPFATPEPGRETVVYDEGGVKIRAFRVEHEPVDPAVGYRFDYSGRSVVISGDTKRSAELQRMSQGVDVLIHEALSFELVGIMHDAAVKTGQKNIAKITFDIPDYHTSPVQAAEIAQAAGAKQLVFYHVVPPLIIPGAGAAFLEGVDAAFDGPVTLGEDGTRVFLPAGGTAIEVDR